MLHISFKEFSSLPLIALSNATICTHVRDDQGCRESTCLLLHDLLYAPAIPIIVDVHVEVVGIAILGPPLQGVVLLPGVPGHDPFVVRVFFAGLKEERLLCFKPFPECFAQLRKAFVLIFVFVLAHLNFIIKIGAVDADVFKGRDGASLYRYY